MVEATGAAELLGALLEGNRRYVAGASQHPRQSAGRRAETLAVQQPLAVVLSCSDSRVPPELIFDCGLGDLFVIRVAGNVLDDVGLGSIEFAVANFGVRLVVVLGHSQCGAVMAAAAGNSALGHVGSITERIRPALERAAATGENGVDAAITANVELAVAELRMSEPILGRLVAAGRLQVVGARYELETGEVRLLVG